MTSISEGPADVDPRGDGRGPAGGLDGRRRRAGRRHGLRRRHQAGRRPRAGDGGRDAAAQPGAGVRLGRRGHARLGRIFNKAACVDGYRDLLSAMAARGEWSRAPATTGRGAAGARRRRTCSRPPSCSRRGPASRPSRRSRPARGLMPAVPASRARACPSGRRRRPRTGVVLEGAAFVVTVLAIALWAAPLATRARRAGRRARAEAGAAAHARAAVGPAQPLLRAAERAAGVRAAPARRSRSAPRRSSCCPRSCSAPAARWRGC